VPIVSAGHASNECNRSRATQPPPAPGGPRIVPGHLADENAALPRRGVEIKFPGRIRLPVALLRRRTSWRRSDAIAQGLCLPAAISLGRDTAVRERSARARGETAAAGGTSACTARGCQHPEHDCDDPGHVTQGPPGE